MSKTLVPEHVRQYEDLLRRISENDKTVNESTMQDFLEKHTAFMPVPFKLNHQLHFNSFISKFPIGPWFTDVAYLTKSTVEWWLVLMELENPHKKIFKGNLDHADFTSDYMHAKQQIDDWKSWIEDHRNEVIASLRRIRVPVSMQQNRVSFKYVLIMGRRNELENSEARKKAIAQKNDNSFRIITYDTILSDYKRNRRSPAESVMLTLYNGDRFKVKSLPRGKSGVDECLGRIDTHLFAYLSPEDVILTSEQIEDLKNDDYEMESWMKGQLLEVNDRYTSKGYAEKFPENWFINRVLSALDESDRS